MLRRGGSPRGTLLRGSTHVTCRVRRNALVTEQEQTHVGRAVIVIVITNNWQHRDLFVEAAVKLLQQEPPAFSLMPDQLDLCGGVWRTSSRPTSHRQSVVLVGCVFV